VPSYKALIQDMCASKLKTLRVWRERECSSMLPWSGWSSSFTLCCLTLV